jgi:hypothetical protein
MQGGAEEMGRLSGQLGLNAYPASSWAATVATALLLSRRNPSRCERSGKAAEEAHLFIAGAIFNREADLDTQGDTSLVYGNGVGWERSEGLLLGDCFSSSYTCPGRDSRRGGAIKGRLQLLARPSCYPREGGGRAG